MNKFLKEILRFCSAMERPVSIKEICTGLNEHEFFVTSAIKNLVALELLEKSADGVFVLTGTASAYMAMSETEQRPMKKNIPLCFIGIWMVT